jgi:hypothetical protein
VEKGPNRATAIDWESVHSIISPTGLHLSRKINWSRSSNINPRVTKKRRICFRCCSLTRQNIRCDNPFYSLRTPCIALCSLSQLQLPTLCGWMFNLAASILCGTFETLMRTKTKGISITHFRPTVPNQAPASTISLISSAAHLPRSPPRGESEG